MQVVKDCAESVANVVVGATALAVGTVNAGLGAQILAALPVAAAATQLGGYALAYFQKHAAESQGALNRIRKSIERDWRKEPQFSAATDEELRAASAALHKNLRECMLDRHALARTAIDRREFPEAAADLVMEALGERHAMFLPEGAHAAANKTAREFARAVICAAFKAAIENPGWYSTFKPHLDIAAARTLGETLWIAQNIEQAVIRIEKDVNQTPVETVRLLMQALAEQGVIKTAVDEGGLNPRQIAEIVAAFGLSGVPPELWAQRLMASAARLRELEAELASAKSASAREAATAVHIGNMGEAARLLAQGEGPAISMTDALEMARTREQSAKLALAVSDHRAALLHYATAAEIIRPFDQGKWAHYKAGEAYAAFDRGEFDADPSLLQRAIACLREALTVIGPAPDAMLWVNLQGDLAAALLRMGVRMGERALIQEAVEASRRILAAVPREASPRQWAMTQSNLGSMLGALSRYDPDEARLVEATEAYRAAASVFVRDDAAAWARVQSGLANALVTLGVRRAGTATLREALDVFAQVQMVRTRDADPRNWALTELNLGKALAHVGAREADAAVLERADAGYARALQELDRAREPLLWATAQTDRAANLTELAKLETGVERLLEAARILYLALEILTQESAPADWAVAQGNLASALVLLAQRTGEIGYARQAAAAHAAVLETRAPERDEAAWAISQNNLGTAYELWGDIAGDPEQWRKAQDCYVAALTVFSRTTPGYVPAVSENVRKIAGKLAAR